MKEQVKCPKCNKRLLDLECEGRAEFEIKCSHCKRVVVIRRPLEVDGHSSPRQLSA